MPENTANELVYVDLEYFTNITYFKRVCKYSNAVFLLSENFRKADFSNRCSIAGANGPIMLSVPLEKGRNQRTIYKEVRICNEEKWQLRHWRSIRSSYNGSPWFHHYSDDMAAIYERKFDFLFDWNLLCMEWLISKFKLPLKISLSDTAPIASGSSVILDLRKRAKAVEKHEADPVTYAQVFENKTGFIPNLSVLDLLFCQGPKTGLELLR